MEQPLASIKAIKNAIKDIQKFDAVITFIDESLVFLEITLILLISESVLM